MAKTLIYLLRHGHSTANGKGVLAGRDNSVHLSKEGLVQAEALSARLQETPWDHIRSSPITRCLETISPLRAALRKGQKAAPDFSKDSAFIEMDYGKWSGKKLSLLSKKSEWGTIQERASDFVFPEGEGFLEAAHRITERLHELSKSGDKILICSHGDIIKMALSFALGSHLDHFQRIAISPASISAIAFDAGRPHVLFMNSTSHLSSVGEVSSSSGDLGGGA